MMSLSSLDLDGNPDDQHNEEIEDLLEPTQPAYVPHRIFINHVDAFNARHISSFITDQIFGALKLMRGPEEGGEEVEERGPVEVQTHPSNYYEFIGTLSAPICKKTEDILYTVSESDVEHFREEILNCGFVIYDITRDEREIPKALQALSIIEEELEKVKSIGPKTFERLPDVTVFILISTVMTWGVTKPLDPNDPELPFSEVDYKKRRPHPNYREHYNCEKEVIKRGQKYKDKLKTYVVTTGIPYGHEEDVLEFFFKMAYYGDEALPILNPGTNLLPLIHITDLAKALHGLMENAPPKPQYILAVEQTPSQLRQILKVLSKILGNSKTTNVSEAEAFIYRDMTQTIFERCTVNLNMEPVFLVENLQLEWRYEGVLPEVMNKIVEEFKASRNLKPVKIVLHGPPGVGKTGLAKKLCEYYGSRYVSVQTMVDEYLAELKELKESIEQRPKEEKSEALREEGEEEEEPEEEEEDPAAIVEEIREIERMVESTNGQLPDDFVIGIMRKFLAKNYCQNRGYVLDGFPVTTQQAKELFGQAGEQGGEEGGGGGDDLGKILPELVVSLEGCDDFLCERIWKQPEEVIHGTIYDEEAMIQRLTAFREANTEDNTVLHFFNELEIDLLLRDVERDDEPFQKIVEKMGPPASFGLSPDELAELIRLEEEERRLLAEKEAMNTQALEERAEQQRKDKMENWCETLQKLQMEEEKVLVARSEPLRHYLMRFVFPTLTKGLLELVHVKPDDPVDFLAEYLFKQNPEGRVFDPSYTEEGEDLYAEFKRDIEALIMDKPEFGM